jgi:uncharacterized membrane protein YfcA
MKKFVAIALAAATMIVTSSVAEAQHYRRAHRGGSVVPWIAGGAALGILGAGIAGSYYYNSCYWERRPVYNRWGDFVGYRDVRVCD